MAHLNNPAGRLHEILRRAMNENREQRARQAWAKLLKVDPPENTPLLLRRLAKVYELPSQITEQVEKYSDNPALYLKWRPKVDQMLSRSNLESQWEQVVNVIDEYTLLSLEHCDHDLSKHSRGSSIDDQRLQEIADKVVELMEEVKEDGIDSDLTTYILGRLEQIMEAIDDFSLIGPAGVRHVLEANVGGLYTQVNIFMSKTNEKEKSYIKHFFVTLHALAAVINITLGVPQLSPGIQQLLVEAPQTEQAEQVNQETRDDVINGEVASSDEAEMTDRASAGSDD